MTRKLISVFALGVLIAGCASNPRPMLRLTPVNTLVRAEPSAVGMARDLDARLDSIVNVAIAQGAAPGVALAGWGLRRAAPPQSVWANRHQSPFSPGHGLTDV